METQRWRSRATERYGGREVDRQRDKEIEIERWRREVYRKCSPEARQAVEDRTHPSPPRVSVGCRLWGFWFRVLGIGFAG